MKAAPLILTAALLLTSVSAQDLTSANGNPWDVQLGTGDVDDGGYDAFDGFGFLDVLIKDTDGTELFSDQGLESFNLTLSGRTWTTPTPLTLGSGGVDVSRMLYAPSDQNYLRYLDSFTNTSQSVLQLIVVFGGDLGSDSETTLARTSSGSVAEGITSADSWEITIENDGFDPNGLATDPPVGLLFGNTSVVDGATSFYSSPFTDPWSGNDDDELGIRFQFTLQPGQTSSLVLFLYRGLEEGTTGPLGQLAPAQGSEVQLAQSVLNGLAAYPDYTGLSLLEQSRIINFTAVPEPATWTLLVAGLGLIGLITRYRR